MTEMQEFLPEIWVYCKTENRDLTKGSKELLGKAQELCNETSYEVAAVLFTGGEKKAVAFGAEKVYRFYSCDEAGQAKALALQMEKGRPWAFLFPATAKGRMVSALLSVKIKTGLTAGCSGLDVEDGFLKQTRPAFGGNLMADVFCRHSYPQMATVQSGVFPVPEMIDNKKAKIIKCPIVVKNDTQIRVMKQCKKEEEMTSLNDAKIVLAGGLGLGSKENFELLRQVAERIGAVPAASRAAVNAGMAPYSWQVGQSGKTIRPKLYIACGISGAVQHLAGIQGAGCIIAVNTDRKAPIFDHADIGIAEDCVTFLRKLLCEEK